MVSAKKLLKLARKWQKLASSKRKRISFPRPTTQEGCFVLYSLDNKRFEILLSYLETKFIKELLEMAEEYFGLPSDGPITLPCDSIFMEYAISLIQMNASEEVEKALVMSITSAHCLTDAGLHGGLNSQRLLCSF